MSRSTLVLVILVLATGLPGCGGDAPPATPVNVVILAIDTLRGDFLSLGGRDWIKDPHISALAADGTYYAECQTTAPWTGPGFASLYTGLDLRKNY